MGRQSVRLQMTSQNRQVPQDQGPQAPPVGAREPRQGQEEHVIRLIAVNGMQILKEGGRHCMTPTLSILFCSAEICETADN